MPSTVISSYEYDPLSSVLTVRFVSGIIYEYLDVPLEVFKDMKASYSKGVYLNKFIKPNYGYKKIESKKGK
jgi:hypothetical protein